MSILKKFFLDDPDSMKEYEEYQKNRSVEAENKERAEISLIREEIEKHSYKTIRAFQDLLPCPRPRYALEYLPKGYTAEQAKIAKLIKKNPNKIYDEYYTQDYMNYCTAQDFWDRWNRFKKLKAFL